MSHHGNKVPGELAEAMSKLKGEYPNGRLNEDDEGALTVAIGLENGAVVLKFHKPVAWIGFTPEQAFEIAEILIKHAREAGFSRAISPTVGK